LFVWLQLQQNIRFIAIIFPLCNRANPSLDMQHVKIIRLSQLLKFCHFKDNIGQQCSADVSTSALFQATTLISLERAAFHNGIHPEECTVC